MHGDDWKTGKQAKTRAAVIACLAEWGGQLIEPVYTGNVSTTDLLHRCADRVATQEEGGGGGGGK